MNILIVKSHPSSKGFSHNITSRYKQVKEDLGNTVKIIDLYKDKEENQYLQFENLSKDFPNNKYTKEQKTLVSWADEIVFIFPMWNFTEPAILKNWYDITFTARFAFRYVQGKMAPIGLLKGKTAKIIVTADAPSCFFSLIGNPLKRIWTMGRLNLCGVKVKNFIILGKMRSKDENARKKILSRIEKLAKK